MLKTLDTNMDNGKWEELMVSLYRMRYQDNHFVSIPAIHSGDAGIEGFANNGVVMQCYYPMKGYDDDAHYEHLRDKMTTDINKLLNNGVRLKKLGVNLVKEWHFVIPEYKDNRIVEHSCVKQQLVLSELKSDPVKYDYIYSDFKIVLKTLIDFKLEYSKMARHATNMFKIKIETREYTRADWKDSESEKENNVRRKLKAILPADAESELLEELVDVYMNYYLKGYEVLNILRVNYIEIYEDFDELLRALKGDVYAKTLMNFDRSLAGTLFNEIMDDLDHHLKENFDHLFADAIRVEIKNDVMGMWLADCSLSFR